MKKVLLINGSPHSFGNTYLVLEEISKTLKDLSIDSSIFWIGNKPVRGCIGCGKCKDSGSCVFSDEMYTKLRDEVSKCDGIIIGSPVYFGGPNGSLCAILDRLFYSSRKLLEYKPAASVEVCRRGGATATFDRLNKYFTVSCMPIVSSQYWNMVHGRTPGEVEKDLEGMQTMRTLAYNMAWMLNSLDRNNHPKAEDAVKTNFVR